MGEDFAIHYSADLSKVVSDLRKLERINEQVAKEFGNDFVKASQVVSDSLNKISSRTVRQKVGKGFKDVQKTVVQTGTVVKLTNGQFRNFGETLTFVDGKLKGTKRSLKDVTSTMLKQEAQSKKSGKASKTFGQNLQFLTKRALTVIPVWLVLRSVFTGFTRLLSSSIKFLIDWEFQMAQIELVGKESSESINILSDSMLNLATSLGISNEQLGEAAKLFIQQGRAASEIIPLLDATAKLSLLTGRTTVQSVEDLTAVLKAFNIDAEKSITVIDLITNVMLNNAITAADLTAAYKQVASTASVLGISLAGLTGFITAIKAETRDAGGKIGLSLRTMFTRITTVSADALQQLTGIPLFLDETGKATKTATSRLRNLENVISDLSLVFNDLGDAQQVQVAKLIGGVRRTNQAIVLFKNFNQVIKSQTDALLGLGKADRAIETLVDTTKIRIQSLTNEWKEFVDTVGDTGVIKNAISFLKNQIEGLSAIIDPQRSFFVGLRAELQKAGQEFQRNEQLARNFTELLALTGNLSDQLGLAKTANEFDLIKDRVQIIVKQIETFNRISPEIKIDIQPTLDANELNKQLEAQQERFVDIQVRAQLDFERSQLQDEFITIGRELQLIINKSTIPGAEISSSFQAQALQGEFEEVSKIIESITKGEFITQDQLDKATDFAQRYELTAEEVVGLERKFNQLSETQAKLINSSGRELQIREQIGESVEREIAKRRTAEQVAEDLFKLEIQSIRENKTKQQLLEDQLKLLERQDQVLTDQLEKRLKNIRKELEKIRATEEQQIFKTVISDSLERLRLAGALNSEILKRKTLLENQFGISRSFSENLARQLQIERDINKEKRLQGGLSSTTIKLFRIARDEGVQVSKEIGDVLAGNLDFASFVRRGGKELEIFKKEFSGIFEQQQAKAFFEGLTVPELPSLRGGFGITVDEEEKVGRRFESLTDALLRLSSTMNRFLEASPRTTLTTIPSSPSTQAAQQVTISPQITTPIDVTVDVSSLDELASNVEDKLAQNIAQVGTKVHNAVKNVVLTT